MTTLCNRFFLLMAMAISGCQSTTPAQESHRDDGGTAFTGRVVYNALEGGFWGVITDSDQQLDGTLPAALQQDGLRVTGRYRKREGMMSFRMWGTPVEFIALEEE